MRNLNDLSPEEIEELVRKNEQFTPEEIVRLLEHPKFENGFDTVLKEWVWKRISAVMRKDLKKQKGS